MFHQLAPECASGLNEERAVDGLVGHLHGAVSRESNLEPTGNLLRGPVETKFLGNNVPQAVRRRKSAGLWPTSLGPGVGICRRGSVSVPTLIACNFATGRGGRAANAASDGPNRKPRRQATRDFLSFHQRKRSAAPVSRSRHDSSRGRQKRVYRSRCPLHRPGDRRHRVAFLPSLPKCRSFSGREFHPSLGDHQGQMLLRFPSARCCVHPLNTPQLFGGSPAPS